jgi:hypothetical protein
MQKFIATGCRMPEQPHGGHKQRHNLQLEKDIRIWPQGLIAAGTESEISLFPLVRQMDGR